MSNFIFILRHSAADADKLRAVLHQLYDYMAQHFAHEEGYMASIGYPGLAEHQTAHMKIIGSMNAILRASDAISELVQKLKHLMHHWLTDHILTEDKAIQRWLAQQPQAQ